MLFSKPWLQDIWCVILLLVLLLIEEKFPELKLKVFIDDENDTQKKDDTKNDEESIRIAVLSLYEKLIEKENSLLDEMAKDAITKLGV